MPPHRLSGPKTAIKSSSVLGVDEPPAYSIACPEGTSPLFITCDHASRSIPRALGNLGLGESDLVRHIAWDIGAATVSRRLAATLDAFCILQNYSRLVIDCNRPPGAPDSIVRISDSTVIPGNLGLSSVATTERETAIFWPYHRRIAEELDVRAKRDQPTVLLAMHSFTPEYQGQSRPWHIGLLFNRDDRLARSMQGLLNDENGLNVGINQPYDVGDETDYAIPRYGEARGLLHLEVELRQDLIADARGQEEWAERLARILPRAIAATRTQI